MMLFVFWFVIKIGLRADKLMPGYDFFSWLLAGMIAWFYLSDVIMEGMNSLKKYKYLLTKMKFPVSVIPTTVVLSNFFVHFLLLSLALIFLVFRGTLDITWLQLPIYMILAVAFMWAWSMFAAPLAAISKDFQQLVKTSVQILFWFSAILWNIETTKLVWLKTVMEFNPISFIVEGYRNALIYHRWIWDEPRKLIIFLAELVILGLMAFVIFRRTRKELVDVL
jgi:teichoic acid transport system permease protein